eukprot:1679745-Amphidinium_carterae.1
MKMHPRLQSSVASGAASSSRVPPSCVPNAPQPAPAARKHSDPPAKRRRTAPKRMGLPEAMSGCVSHTKER